MSFMRAHVLLLLFGLGLAAAHGGQSRDEIEVVAVGEIVDIDHGKATFVLRSRDVELGSSRGGGLGGTIGIGIGSGPDGRFPSGRDPFPTGRLPVPTGPRDPFPPFPGDDGEDDLPTSTGAARYTRSKVLTDAFTRIAQQGREIEFADLSEGDRVTVTGRPRGSEIVASLVERSRAVIPD